MKNAPKISVLVPAYNVDLYIREFLNSLVNQTLKDIEIIIVNDASPDKCHDIINEFLVDKRIKYINKIENEGLWKARQSAYELTTAEYVINLDPDDYIDLNFLEELYSHGAENDLDIVQSNVKIIDEKNQEIGGCSIGKLKERKVLKTPSDYKILLGSPYASWFRLVKKDLLERFNYNYLKGELTLFSLQFCDNVTVGINPIVSYHYRKHSTSLSNYGKSAKRMSITKEYNWDNIQRKTKELIALPIASEPIRNVLNMYAFRVLYSLTMISWLAEDPSNEYRNQVGNYYKSQFNLTIINYAKHVLWFKRSEQLFLTACILNMESIVSKKLRKSYIK